MDSYIHCRTINFFTLDALNVDHILLAIDLNYLANLLTFVVTSNNLRYTMYLKQKLETTISFAYVTQSHLMLIPKYCTLSANPLEP